MVKRFLKSARLGFYLRVLKTGEVGAGDEIILIHRDESRVSAMDIARLYLRESKDRGLLQPAAEAKARPAGWRDALQALLEE